MGVFEQTQYVLERSPEDPRALTYQASCASAWAERDNAAKLLTKATKIDPSLTDAWIGIAWIKTQEGLPAQAQAAIAEATRRHPEDADPAAERVRGYAAAGAVARREIASAFSRDSGRRWPEADEGFR